jgi:hypothetical protein
MMNLRYNFINAVLLVAVMLFATCCQAPRNNPLDPENPANSYQYMSGEVKSVSIPYINAGPGWLHFTKAGYYSDSTYVFWQNTSELHFDIFLNAHPMLEDCEAYSIIENRYPSLQTERMQINVELSDIDNDIDSVFLNIDILDQIHLLGYNTTSKSYERTFSIYELDISSIEQLTGHPLSLSIKDIFENIHILEISSIKRVIREEVIFISPSGNEITSATPTLSWQKFNPGFSHTYSLEVFTSEITPQMVWHVDSLPDSLSECTVDVALVPGEYFWVIWAIDEFGNRSRSKPASFKIE